MKASIVGVLMLAAIEVSLPDGAHSAEYQANGISFRYPDTWQVASKENRQALIQELRGTEQFRQIDLDRLEALIFNPAGTDFLENMNIGFIPGGMEVSAEEVSKGVEALGEVMTRAGMPPDNIHGSVLRLGDNAAISIEWDVSMQGYRLHQWGIVIPGGDRSVMLTCSATAADFESVRPKFKETVVSINTNAGLIGAWHEVPKAIQWAIIGTLLGLGLTLVQMLFRFMGAPPASVAAEKVQQVQVHSPTESERVETTPA